MVIIKNEFYKKLDNRKKINYFNNDKLIKNEFNNDKLIINKYIEKYDNYKSVDSFSGLFNRSVTSSIGSKTSLYTAVVSTIQRNQSQTNRQVNQQVQSIPSPSQATNGGRTYNTNAMWSPQSFAGIVYEWNRGVVGISLGGNIEKEILDGTLNHHADATVRIAEALGSPIEKTTTPFEAAVNCANKGLLIFQSEGDNAFVYFPSSISEEQLNGLTDIVTPRNGFNFSYTYEKQIYEDQTMQDVINFAMNINVMANVPRM